MVIMGGSIAAAPMGDPNASIPTPQPMHYRPMFGAYGKLRTNSSVTFISQAAHDNGLRKDARRRQACCRSQTREAASARRPHDPQLGHCLRSRSIPRPMKCGPTASC
jgi:urease alpha subunit